MSKHCQAKCIIKTLRELAALFVLIFKFFIIPSNLNLKKQFYFIYNQRSERIIPSNFKLINFTESYPLKATIKLTIILLLYFNILKLTQFKNWNLLTLFFVSSCHLRNHLHYYLNNHSDNGACIKRGGTVS
ncbi:hypothetical protein BpHYR1_009686 [Brachionus plicatilis]|uniref:Uncharacterized protein n=1 Tax=Brachionus plicatilis TaxID=10195 RepID=A0A3M7RK30_BRAPC|nr:hypothetical protein BpHYR1_009686 [Brachionus plicatilis]